MTILCNEQLNIYILIQIATFTGNVLITIMYYMGKFWFSKLMQSQFHYNSLSADGSQSVFLNHPSFLMYLSLLFISQNSLWMLYSIT